MNSFDGILTTPSLKVTSLYIFKICFNSFLIRFIDLLSSNVILSNSPTPPVLYILLNVIKINIADVIITIIKIMNLNVLNVNVLNVRNNKI